MLHFVSPIFESRTRRSRRARRGGAHHHLVRARREVVERALSIRRVGSHRIQKRRTLIKEILRLGEARNLAHRNTDRTGRGRASTRRRGFKHRRHRVGLFGAVRERGERHFLRAGGTSARDTQVDGLSRRPTGEGNGGGYGQTGLLHGIAPCCAIGRGFVGELREARHVVAIGHDDLAGRTTIGIGGVIVDLEIAHFQFRTSALCGCRNVP